MIKAENIKTKQTIINILDNLKVYNLGYIAKLQENSFEYEDVCERVEEQLCEIDEALVGAEPFDDDHIFKSDSRMMFGYWKYLNGKCNLNNLIKSLKKYSDKLLINMD